MARMARLSAPLLVLAALWGCQSIDPHATGPTLASQFSCYACHKNLYTATTLPAHKALGLSLKCDDCHTVSAWKPATGFKHDAYWPLTGVHTTTACEKCHTDPAVEPPKACVGCHQANYDATTTPNHKDSAIPTTCEGCHSTAAWKPATLNHDLFFPLLGKHQTTACTACHTDPAVKPPKTCVGCHQAQYDASTTPNHAVTGLATTCETCHTPSAWKPATFSHDPYYPLVGVHVTTACAGCHKTAGVKPSKTCVDCHQANYDATTTPNHKTDGISTTCEACHTPVAWKPATLNHDQFFPLTGKHATVQCSDCHKTAGVKPPKTCVGCHQANYDATTNPNHVSAGMPTTCETCHTTTGWSPATFDHSKYWLLTGKHATTTCSACHKTPGVKLATVCSSCHQANYDATTNPNHAGVGLPTTCETCHTTTAWTPASFNHSQYWALTGKHTTTACNACHKAPGKLPTDCYACHQANYVASTNPSHTSLGLPTTCTTCHTTTAWQPASFPSHKFPLSGGHNIACSICHTNPANYKAYSCYVAGCHNASSVASQHSGVSGFTPTAQACVSCHPSGQVGG